MKVSDILTEEITLSIETTRVLKCINHAIDLSMKFACDTILQQIKEPNNKITDHKSLVYEVTDIIEEELVIALKTVLLSVYGNPPYNVSKLLFVRQLNSNGACSQSTIKIHYKFVENIKNFLADSVNDSYGEVVFQEDGNIDTYSLKDVFNNYKRINGLDSKIFEIAQIFIHELVHVKQHAPQSKRLVDTGSTEYRSYITKKQKEFNKALNNLTSEYNFKIYHASPQEIPAFAHNLANDLINTATNHTDINEITDLYDLEWLINNLKDIIQDNRNYKYNDHFNNYEKFNNPQNQQHYKVFKRFMKLVYKEIFNYIHYIQTRYNNLKQNPDYDIQELLK